jgi:hypothetical protein
VLTGPIDVHAKHRVKTAAYVARLQGNAAKLQRLQEPLHAEGARAPGRYSP